MIRILTFVAVALSTLGASLPLHAEPPPRHYFVFETNSAPFEDQADGDMQLVEAMMASVDILERRLDAIGDLAYQLDYRGENRIGLLLLGENAPEIAQDVFGIRGDLAFKLVDPESLPEDTAKGEVRPGSVVLPMADSSEFIAVRADGGMSGEHLSNASLGLNSQTKEPVVNLTLDEAGKEKFAALTTASVGKRLAIVLDGTEITAPVINEPIIDGAVQITGSFTYEEARKLAIALWSGALPVPFELIEHRETAPEQ